MTDLLPGITVIIPTFKRVADLDRCLRAIDQQRLKPVEVLITYRPEDEETATYLSRTDRPGLGTRIIVCVEPGVVYALTLAFNEVRSEFFATTDDDSMPHPDWLQRIMAHFEADLQAAGVGGKDHVCADGRWLEGAEPVVGKVLWNGRLIGHHHLGVGPARYVDTLKGVNLAFRNSAIGHLRPDTRLRGRGAQVGWEMHLTLTLIAQGHKLIYDPQVLVEHIPGVRPEAENRVYFNPVSLGDEVFNRTLTVMEFLGTQPWGRLRQLALLTYLGIMGSRKTPGLMLLGIGLVTRRPNTWARFKTTIAAYRDALASMRKASARQYDGGASGR
jgi:cellulose synthase/poly-beta-1,6-N-acetylglucosamine synthase-like glycosyltransferase